MLRFIGKRLWHGGLTLAALVTLRPRLPDAASMASGASGARPVFLLDAWRLAYRDQAAAEDRTDNRYYLTEADLPDAATLQARGIRQVIYVTETLGDDPSLAVEEDDLHDAFLRYGQAGVALTLVGLDELAGERALAAPVQSSVVVLGANVATTLFPDGDAVGQSIRISGLKFTVVGVLASKGQAAMGNDQDDVVVMPIARSIANSRTEPAIAAARA